MRYDSLTKKVWRIISPILLYYLIIFLVSYASSFFITLQVYTNLPATADVDALYEELLTVALDATMTIYLISGIILIPLLLRMVKKDMTYRPWMGDSSSLEKWKLVYCVAAGVLCCAAASIALTISQATDSAQLYTESMETIYSSSMIIQVLASGFVLPAAEEYIFRGLIYRRLKDYLPGLKMPMLLSALIFGAFHGNLIQFVYGFVMGLVLVFLYEHYQTMAAPILCHIGANMISLILEYMNVQITSIPAALLVAAACIVVLYFVLKAVQSQVHVNIIPNPTYIDISVASYANTNDSGSYDSGYHSGYGSDDHSGYGSDNGSGYDSGYGSYNDSGYGSGYGSDNDSGYGSGYDSGYNSDNDSDSHSGSGSGSGSGFGWRFRGGRSRQDDSSGNSSRRQNNPRTYTVDDYYPKPLQDEEDDEEDN